MKFQQRVSEDKYKKAISILGVVLILISFSLILSGIALAAGVPWDEPEEPTVLGKSKDSDMISVNPDSGLSPEPGNPTGISPGDPQPMGLQPEVSQDEESRAREPRSLPWVFWLDLLVTLLD